MANYSFDKLVSNYPAEAKHKLSQIRNLIFEVANSDANITEITECLKWGEPSFVPSKTVGTTIRIDWKAKNPNYVSVFFNCKTKMIARLRTLYEGKLNFIGNREIRLAVDQDLPVDILKHAFHMALTYNLK
ncbi:MAG: DUF1801 domain-containing protein [Rickettsiales bacterium]